MKSSGKNHISILTRFFFLFIFFTLSYFVFLPTKIEATCCTENSDCVSGAASGKCTGHNDSCPTNRACIWTSEDSYCCDTLGKTCISAGQNKTCQNMTPAESVIHPQCTYVCSGNVIVTGNNNFLCFCTEQIIYGVHSWRCTPANTTCSADYRVDYNKCPGVSSTNQGGTYNCVVDTKKGAGETCFNNLECATGLSCLPDDMNNPLSPKKCTKANRVGTTGSNPVQKCDNNGSPGILTALGCIPFEYEKFVPSLLGFLAGIIGAIALVVMLIGTITIMTASGNPEAVKKGKELFTAAITGLLFIIFSVALLRIVAGDIIKLPGF